LRPQPASGKTVSHYRILERLGGGVGIVYKAQKTRLDRFVGLKFLPDAVAQDSHALARFPRQAKVASALHRSNLRAIQDNGEDAGRASTTEESF
jgi:serine/threonine protein kinase